MYVCIYIYSYFTHNRENIGRKPSKFEDYHSLRSDTIILQETNLFVILFFTMWLQNPIIFLSRSVFVAHNI